MGTKIQAFDIFQTPLSSHYPLPLNTQKRSRIVCDDICLLFSMIFLFGGMVGPHINSANRKFADLQNLLYLRTPPPTSVAICGFAICGPNFFPPICKSLFFSLELYTKMFLFEFLLNKKIRSNNPTAEFRYSSFDIKVYFPCIIVENLRFCNLRTGSHKKLADYSKEIFGFEICGLAYLRNLRI